MLSQPGEHGSHRYFIGGRERERAGESGREGRAGERKWRGREGERGEDR